MTRSARLRRGLIGLLLGAVLASSLGACSSGGERKTVTAWFSSAISLYKDSQVRVLGLPAGRVTAIKVEGARVRVVMSIPADIPVPADASATIIPLSFIGERYVQLFPAWKEGLPQIKDGAVIPLERTSVPVEPDEALAAVKHLLDSIDPIATGKLVTNLAAGLDGTGKALNDALNGLGTISETLGAKDQQVAAIIDHFDRLTATLATRDQTLGRVLDAFATTTDALADERVAIQSLLGSISSLATNAFDLVNEHHVRLDKDLTVLSRTLRLVGDNIDELDKVLLAGPTLVSGPNYDGKAGFAAAYNKDLHALDLRAVLSPSLSQAFTALGIPNVPLCTPIDVTCQFGETLTTPALPSPQVLPSGGVLDRNQPSPAALRAKADAHATKKKSGGLSGLFRSLSRVFG